MGKLYNRAAVPILAAVIFELLGYTGIISLCIYEHIICFALIAGGLFLWTRKADNTIDTSQFEEETGIRLGDAGEMEENNDV